MTAFGGAWKDAPVEGFQLAKFFRSPVVATVWGYVLLAFTSDLPALILAAGGLSVATIETYKTFLAGGPPGKFATKPVRFVPDRARRACRLAHATTYLLLAAGLTATLLQVRPGAASAGQSRPGDRPARCACLGQCSRRPCPAQHHLRYRRNE